MSKLKYILLILTIISLGFSCGSKESSTEVIYQGFEEPEVREDGTYCADVEYYNPRTGTRNTYELNVDVENNQVTVIHFPNGGWMDDDHITPEDLDVDGKCTYTSDRNNEYTIQIKGPECSYSDEYKMRNDHNSEVEKRTCSECGREKDKYDDYCDDCKDKKEKTCKKCGQYDSQMYSSDEQCSDCTKKEKEEEEAARKKKEEENE
jgi:hypothetical protein